MYAVEENLFAPPNPHPLHTLENITEKALLPRQQVRFNLNSYKSKKSEFQRVGQNKGQNKAMTWHKNGDSGRWQERMRHDDIVTCTWIERFRKIN